MTEPVQKEDEPAVTISRFWLKRLWLPILVPALLALGTFAWHQITAVATLREGFTLMSETIARQDEQIQTDRLLIQQIQLEAARSAEKTEALGATVERISTILREIDRDVAGVKAVQEANGG